MHVGVANAVAFDAGGTKACGIIIHITSFTPSIAPDVWACGAALLSQTCEYPMPHSESDRLHFQWWASFEWHSWRDTWPAVDTDLVTRLKVVRYVLYAILNSSMS